MPVPFDVIARRSRALRSRGVLTIGLLVLGPAGQALGAQAAPAAAGAVPPLAARVVSSPPPALPPLISSARRSSHAERFVSGWVVGTVVLLGVSLLRQADAGDDGQGITPTLVYAGAVTGGVVLAAARREGARPWRTLAGALVGAAPLFVTARGNCSTPCLPLMALGWVTTPLAASIAHGVGAP